MWIFGGWVVITYGVLINRTMGAGEEKTFIRTWGLTFLVHTFGLQSLMMFGRKAAFMWVVDRVSRGMRTTSAIHWYEGELETRGGEMLAGTGLDAASPGYDDEEDHERDDDHDAGGGDGGVGD